MITYRAAFLKGGTGTVLTLPEHSSLSDSELIAEALEEAQRAGIEIDAADIAIGDWQVSAHLTTISK
jgi:hypothetical protein